MNEPCSLLSGLTCWASLPQRPPFSPVHPRGLMLMGPGLLGFLNSQVCVFYFWGGSFCCQLLLFFPISASRSFFPVKLTLSCSQHYEVQTRQK